MLSSLARLLRHRIFACGLVTALLCGLLPAADNADDLRALKYGQEKLVVDLGVGLWAWPLPMDYDGDGDLDLVVACPDKPYNGVYLFENPSQDPKQKLPVFKRAKRLGRASHNYQICYVDGKPRVLKPGEEFVDFRENGFSKTEKVYKISRIHPGNTRANQWKYADLDGDGALDLVVGIGDWTRYGWDEAYDAQGRWHNDPLHGYVYLIRNAGSNDEPKYEEPRKLTAGGADIDVFGMPSPNFVDFDGDGDLDLLCGEFLDGFTYFENIGSKTQPAFAVGRKLTYQGQPVHMDLEMITPTAIDWDGDGDTDLIVGDEDGRVALVENTGRLVLGMPEFLPPRYFQQQADDVKCGALATPFGCDWDGDGDEDVICGNTAGYVFFYENVGGGVPPRFAAGKKLEADGEVIRIQAGPNGSIQGPCEAKWGYTTLSVADWDMDGLPDLLLNSIWGEILWYRNCGTRTEPKLQRAQAVDVEWPGAPPKPSWFWWDPNGKQLVTQWRTTPMAIDFNDDGLTDLVMLDQEGYLTLFERRRENGKLQLLPPQRIFLDDRGEPLRLNARSAGRSGRVKIMVVDWDGDGRKDVLVNSSSADWYRNVETRDGKFVLKRVGTMAQRNVSGHTSSPTVVDWDKNGKPDLLVGSEDGRLYYLNHDQAVQFSADQLTKLPAPDNSSAEGMQPGVVKEEFLFTKAPFAQCHASTIAQTPSGFTSAWFGGTREGKDDVAIWYSRFDGQAWSSPRKVADGVQYDGKRYPCWNPVLYQTAEGPLLLFYKCGPKPNAWWGMLAVSYDRGRNWSWPCRLPEGIDGPVKNKPVLLDGALWCPSSTEYDGWRVHFEVTRDFGQTWQRIGPINDGKEFNAIQPSILQHADGRLQVLCRSQEGKVVQSWSSDGGQNWGKMTATSLPNPNSGTDAVTLADGRHLLVYNHTVRGGESPRNREMLNVAVSGDGEKWQAALLLENAKGEYSYPAVIQADDGLVHIVYTWQRTRIKHVVVDPSKLVLRDMPEGKWPLATP